MGEVHQLLLLKGADEARARAATRAERSAIDAAAAVPAEEEIKLGITHAGFAMMSLPHCAAPTLLDPPPAARWHGAANVVARIRSGGAGRPIWLIAAAL